MSKDIMKNYVVTLDTKMTLEMWIEGKYTTHCSTFQRTIKLKGVNKKMVRDSLKDLLSSHHNKTHRVVDKNTFSTTQLEYKIVDVRRV